MNERVRSDSQPRIPKALQLLMHGKLHRQIDSHHHFGCEERKKKGELHQGGEEIPPRNQSKGAASICTGRNEKPLLRN